MKIGDTVRFLNDVGGGRVSGFQGKDMVLVEDEDGFDVPCLLTDVIVVETDAPRPVAKKPVAATPVSDDPADRPVTFRPKPLERRGGNMLNVYLGFMQDEADEEMFEAHLVNDSNYRLDVLFLVAEGAAWRVSWRGTVEPNTKKLVATFSRRQLPEMEHVAVQLMASKAEATYLLKPAMSVQLRLDAVQFYKLSAFQPSPFFRRAAYVMDVVRDDRPARRLFVEAEELGEAIQMKNAKCKVQKAAPRHEGNVIDLHIDALLDDTTGLTPADILRVQLSKVEETLAAAHKGTRLVFIHGKGNGVLRQKLLNILRHKYKGARWQDASFQEYGFGATQVTV